MEDSNIEMWHYIRVKNVSNKVQECLVNLALLFPLLH